MRISDFLKGLNEAETKQDLTPAQQSIDTGAVQSDTINPVTPENETTGEASSTTAAAHSAGDGTETDEISAGSTTPMQGIETSPDEGKVDLSKDSDDEEGEGNDDTNSGSSEQGSDDVPNNPVDQADSDMDDEVQQQDEAVIEGDLDTVCEGFAALISADTGKTGAMKSKAAKLGFVHGYYGQENKFKKEFADDINSFSDSEKAEYEAHVKKGAAAKSRESIPMSEELTFAQQFAKTLAEGTEFKLELKMDGLFESQGFEAEFAGQAKEIFEAAVNDSAKQHLDKVNAYAAYVMEEMLAEKVAELEESVETRLNEAIATWTEANRLSIESGIRTQVAESFMAKLNSLLAEHFVEVPVAKKDMFEAKVAEVDALKNQLAESVAAYDETKKSLQEEVAALRKQVAIDAFVRGMSMMQAERIRSLAEGITYVSDEKFIGKLRILRESYVNKPKSKNIDTLVEDVSPVITEVETQIVEEGDPEILEMARKMRT